MTDVSRWVKSRLRGDHKTRLKTISAILWGFLRATRLGVTAIAEGMEAVTCERYRIRRVWRFFRNVKSDPTPAMEALCREAASLGRRTVVALDWVELRGGCRALVAGMCTGKGRAMPLAWKVVKANEFPRSQNDVEERFMRDLKRFVDMPSKVVVVADRGFGRATFIALLEELGFRYVIRIRGHVHARGEGYSGLVEEYPLAEGHEADLGRVSYREDGIVETRLVMRWARGAKEPWYLATNLTRKVANVCADYALRMEEEESFRDLKSHRYGFALRYVKLSEPERYERLMMIWAMGVWLLYAQGLAGIRRNLHLGLSSAPDSRRDLSVVRIGAKLLRKPLGGPPGLLRALAA